MSRCKVCQVQRSYDESPLSNAAMELQRPPLVLFVIILNHFQLSLVAVNGRFGEPNRYLITKTSLLNFFGHRSSFSI